MMRYEINDKMINFFKEAYGVDVSNVKILFTNDEGALGFYNPGFKGFIFLNRVLLDEKREWVAKLTIVHELQHLIQFEYGKSLMLNLEKMDATTIHHKFNNLSWEQKPLEIDAQVTESYYVYKIIGMEKGIDAMRYCLRRIDASVVDPLRIIKGLTLRGVVEQEFIDFIKSILIKENELEIA